MVDFNPSDIITGATLVDMLLRHARPKPKALLVLTGGSSRGLAKIVKLAEYAAVSVRWVERDEMNKLTDDDSVEVAVISGERPIRSLAEVTPAPERSALLLALVGVEDPYNVGMILRTAWAAHVDGVILENHAKELPRNLLARSSAGASECMPIVFCDNMVDSLSELATLGVTTCAADDDGTQSIYTTERPSRIAFVIGGERRGLSRAVASACERSIYIPMAQPVKSLCAVSSAAILLFEQVRRRGKS